MVSAPLGPEKKVNSSAPEKYRPPPADAVGPKNSKSTDTDHVPASQNGEAAVPAKEVTDGPKEKEVPSNTKDKGKIDATHKEPRISSSTTDPKKKSDTDPKKKPDAKKKSETDAKKKPDAKKRSDTDIAKKKSSTDVVTRAIQSGDAVAVPEVPPSSPENGTHVAIAVGPVNPVKTKKDGGSDRPTGGVALVGPKRD